MFFLREKAFASSSASGIKKQRISKSQQPFSPALFCARLWKIPSRYRSVCMYGTVNNKNRLCQMTCGLEENCKKITVHEVQKNVLGIPPRTQITLPRSQLKNTSRF